jgi:hypothetical protein
MQWHLGLRSWQIGCLFGLVVGLAQAVSGNLEIASLPIEEGIARLIATMMGSAVLCAIGAGVLTGVAGGEDQIPRPD